MPRWTRQYDPGVPETLAPYPDKTLVDYVRHNAAAKPNASAILFKGSSLSNAELDRLSSAFASGLAGHGVRRGDRVALVLPNSPQFLIAEIGAWKAGAAVLPLNPLYTGSELVEPLRSADVEIVVALTPFYRRLKDIQSQTAVKRIVATNIKEYLPPFLRILFTLAKERKDGHRIALDAGDVWFKDMLTDQPVTMTGPAPDEPAILLMSGGTTGTAKAVVGLHRSLTEAGHQLNAWLRPAEGSRPDIALMPLPLFHVYACVGAQSHALVGGTPMALVVNPRDLDDLLKTIERVKPTLLSAVPALLIALMNHPRVKSRSIDFSSIRACFSGAAPLLAATKAQFEAITGGRIVEGYSLTEAMMACVVNPLNGPNKTGSVGLPLPDVEVAIVDAESGERVLPQGERGEIILRAPQLMAGYWNNPDETARALRPHGEGGPWLHTGDLGYLDEDSYLFIVDRQKDLIKSSGCQVWPREIEEVLALHPAILEVGVAGVPDERKGEAVKAWVVLKPGASASLDELRAYSREKLAPFKVPSHIEFRESLPKTMAGKVLRRALVSEHQHKIG
ncbi:MAG: AMP-binding protein [Vicinamibacterales bacterium]|nr:AMP-binding protein [Vicinamibacterales bacterium]